MSKILIAMPSYTGSIPLEVMSRLNALSVPAGCEINFAHTKRVFIDKARNGIGKKMLDTDNDYLLFIDDDQIPSPNVITEFLKLDKDIIGCPIPSRRGDEFIAVFDKDIERLNEWKGTKECGAIGMATTMIKRHVIEKVFKEWSNPFTFEVEQDEKGVHVSYSEDVTFCKRARALGFEVWCTDKVWSQHIGGRVVHWYNEGYKSEVIL